MLIDRTTYLNQTLTKMTILIFRGRLIQDLIHLRQLDEVEISAKEKREVGLEASSDEDEEEEEELEFKAKEKPQEGNLLLI